MSGLAAPLCGQAPLAREEGTKHSLTFVREHSPVPSTKVLVLDRPLLARLGVLADGLHREIVLCILGHTIGDSTRARDFVMPSLRSSLPVSVAFDDCPDDTVALWHNHPWRVETDDGYKRPAVRPRRPPIDGPAALCKLSTRDVQMAVVLDYPFSIVAVDRDTWCWWSVSQVKQLAQTGHVPAQPIRGQTSTPRTRRPY